MSLSARDFNIYVDADFSVHKESAKSIYDALTMVVAEQKRSFPEHNFTVIKLDHRGSTARSLMNYKKIIADPKALVVFTGLHSPPLITNNEFINKNKVLSMVTWAAGAPITRSKTNENWLFRLSIDDSQAGGFISKYAVNKGKCEKPFLLLEDTPWGKSNERNMEKALRALRVKSFEKAFYGWGVSSASASKLGKDILESKSDCIFFVGNGKDAKTFFSSFSRGKVVLPIYSHWGITGGDNKEIARIIKSGKLKLKVIQTKFSFLSTKMNSFQKTYLEKILNFKGYKSAYEIQPMTGWVHTIDLSNILFKVLRNVNLNKDKAALQKEIAESLENITQPIEGLLKTYRKPFSKYNKTNKNAHEALGLSDYIMFEFQEDGSLK